MPEILWNGNAVFQPLTPLWTGDVDRNSAIARETSIIGNLRWWYEALIRGYGGKACSPVETEGEGACRYDLEKGEKSICPACRLFGCTGWARRFRLTVLGLKEEPLFFYATDGGYSATGNWLWRVFGGLDTGGKKTGKGRDTAFSFGVQQLWGEKANFQFTALFSPADKILSQLAFLCHVVSKYGGFGAKQQHGFGQMKWLNGELEAEILKQGKKSIRENAKLECIPCRDAGKLAPNFAQFFSIKFRLPNWTFKSGWRPIGTPASSYHGEYIPCAFSLRYKTSLQGSGLRTYLRDHLDIADLHTLMGNSRQNILDEDRSASRIFVSHPYRDGKEDYFIKVYGFVPPLEDTKITVGRIAELTKDCFTQALFRECKLEETIFWKEIKDAKL
jgi:CRISPR-associated protein Cmr1